MSSSRAGNFVQQGIGDAAFRAFIPAPLPPTLDLARLQGASEKAGVELGRLDGIARVIPNLSLFLYMYVRKEAVLSSQIEGTQSSLSDLLAHEAGSSPGAPVDADVNEVSNYVAAMEHGLRRLKELPVSLRLLREIHGVLMKGARGGEKSPGDFRRTQNWIGGSMPGNARFVPPPPHEMHAALNDFERFLHADSAPPPLIKAGLAHAQFETIHPFLDGNGRMGRLLITFLLVTDGVLGSPLLYLSLYLKKHRDTYYDLLQRVRTHGEWEEWMLFYLSGVADVAAQATETIQKLLALLDTDKQKLESRKASPAARRVFERFCRYPVSSIPGLAAELELTHPTAAKAVRLFVDEGILVETTGRQRDRVFVYERYLRVLEEGTKDAVNVDGHRPA